MSELYAPLITPFDDQESVDVDGFLKNLAWYEDRPLDGYLINGSSGEAEMLTREEQRHLLNVTRRHSERKLFFGIAPTSVRGAIDELAQLEGVALEGVLVRTPSYFGSQLDQAGFYREVAVASPWPIFIYQIPQNTGVKLDEMVLGKLMEHPNIGGIKDSLGDLSLLGEVNLRPGFRYLLGASNLLLAGVRGGAAGGILALANVVPEACRRLLDLAEAGEWEEAVALQRRLNPLNRAIGGSRGYGIAGLKAAVEARGLVGGAPRRPLRPLPEEEARELRRLVEEALTLRP